jgi:acetyl esterase/lipase
MGDAVAVWRGIIRAKDPGKIVLGGTSAGGNRTLAFVLGLKASAAPPAVDMEKAGTAGF